ncbi:efflux transporter outer membrane subunit [Flavobacterium sp. LB2P84]|uniref:Efflux transporter outer membrane subunit n=1 Tax=Flavobacterium yafengii TaxID=3041253 RepID=A0AAW6TR27_9FLAO|nr:efflux transporter outer membrane subunit [Flavobacterium yafengii]MDI5950949.1 efflux transporter outer membrane subunit [Flavobacterium yafengii]MDI6034275.1 efflux transporter outer membrane subunit [Flavobacterium yafengii]MDI6046735.1 efflux transporter outer membrane subunit [Flavobacterium yafengii]
MKNNIYKIVLLGVTATVMQSCFVAKEYDRPELKTENLYRNEIVSTDTISLANVAWDKVFTDPLLQGYIKKGLENNLDIKIAMQNIAAAEATMKQGKAGYFPTLSASTDWTHQELSKNSQFGALLQNRSTDQYQLTGSLSWEADIWGKIRSNKRAVNATYLQTTAANQAVKTQLIANIAATYYQLLSVDAQIKLAEKTLVNRNQSIETIIALKDAGNVTEVGVKQTEAQKYATEIILADLKNSIIILENTMSILMGQGSAKIERNTFETQSMQPTITLGVPATLLRNRPDVIAAEYNLISNFEQTNVAKSNFYPTLKLTANGGLQSIDLKEWFSANSIFANVITGLTQPIFNQRQIKTRFEIAKANQEKAYLQFEQSLLTAGKEVSDALAQYNNETYKLTVREKQVDALNKATDYSDELLTYGLANYLEVLTVKDNALNAELSLIDNKFQQYKAIIQLYRALGGGWQ